MDPHQIIMIIIIIIIIINFKIPSKYLFKCSNPILVVKKKFHQKNSPINDLLNVKQPSNKTNKNELEKNFFFFEKM